MRNTSVVPAAEVGLDDARVAADRVGRALGDLLAEVQHGHAVGDAHDHRHVVLDEEQRQPALEGDLADEGGGVARLPRRHAGRGLVEQQQDGAGGERHADLEVALLAVREVLGVADGACSPETTLKSVDLPAPFGPITEKTWPASTAKLTRVSAASAPNRLETVSTSRITPPRVPSAARRSGAARAGPGA